MMSDKFLYLIWKHPDTRRNYTVGKLTRGPSYKFEYCEEYSEAKENGLPLIDAFPNETQYESDKLFSVFSSRLPDPKRRDIAAILQHYGLEEYDEFEILKRSGGRLPIDTYEFIDPIFPEEKEIERSFYIMGIRYKSNCGGEDCNQLPGVHVGDELKFVPEPENQVDSSAIIVETLSGDYLGYVPRYYNKAILKRLGDGKSYSCVVCEVNRESKCSECVKVTLNIPKK